MKKVPFAAVSGVVAGALLLASAAHASVYSTAVLADSPTVYYEMNDSTTTVTDSASLGGSNNGVYRNGGTALVGSPGPLLGQLGPRPAAFPGMDAANVATKFDGIVSGVPNTAADNVLLANASVTISSNYSVEFWFNGTNLKYSTPSSLSYIFSRGGTATAIDGIGVNGTLSGITPKKLFYANGVSGNSFGPDIAENTWYHLVFVRSGNNLSFYLNGNLEGTATSTVNFTTDDFQFAAQIGIPVSGAPHPHSFNGHLDEIAIYDSVLSAAQITAHYNAAIPEPSSVLLLGCSGLLLIRRRQR
ncbi:MAG: LamG domain-containing protein [Phycisphaeraceae bacterium]|nr:LamG domain-containing protein [Phycisphaeraceae bacterium]